MLKNKKIAKTLIAANEGVSCLGMEKLLMESLPLCVKMFDSQGNLLFINKDGREEHSLEGWTDAQIRKWKYLDCISSESRPRVIRAMQDALAGKSSSFEIRHTLNHAKGGFCDSTIAPLKTNGEIQYIIFSSSNITDRKKAEEEVINSEAKFHSIFDDAIDGILIADIKTKRFVMANSAICRFLGYRKEELLKMDVPDIHPKKQLPVVMPQFKRLAKGEAKVNESVPCQKKDGSIVFADITGKPVLIDGRLCNMGFFRDITERKQVDEALKESERRFRFLTERSLDAIFQTDARGVITYISPSFMRMSGFRETDVLGRHFDHFLAKGEKIKAHTAFETSNQSNSPTLDLQLKILKSDGSFFWGELSGHPIIKEGRMVGTEGSIRNINRRKHAEEEREQFFKFFKLSTDIMVIADPLGRFIRVNPACLQTLGYSEAELLSKPFIDFVHPEDKQSTRGAMARQMQSGFTLNFENRYLRKDGSALLLSWRANYNKNEGVTYATARDITEQKKAEEALQKSEKRYHDIFESSQDALMLLDGKGFFDCNRATLKIFGYKTVRDFCSKHPGQVSPPTQPDGTPSLKLANRRIRDAFKQGSNLFEWIHRRKNGTDFVASVLLVPFELEGRKVLQATVRDITEQKKAEQEILRLKEFQERIIWNSPVGIVTTDIDGNITSANPTILRLLGSPSEEKTMQFNVLTLKSMITQGLSPLFKKCLEKGKNTQAYGMPYTSYWGKSSFISLKIVPMSDNRGKQIGSIALIEDITERRKAEEEIKDWAHITQENPRPILRIGKNAILLYANPASKALLKGWKPKIGAPLTPLLWKAIRPHTQSQTPFEFELTLNKTIFSCLLVPIPEREYLNLYFLDITEQKKIEQTKMEMISMASHQLRTPPTGIKWFATMLLDEDVGKINPKQRSYLNEILFNNQKMIDLVHSLLNVSRIELGTFFVSAKLQRIRVTTVIDDILEELGSQIRDQKLTVIKKYGKNLPPLQVDSGLFRIILQNLINNAAQYTNDGDKITVGVKRKKSELLITVSDTGLGIPKAQQPNLFSKFFRADNVVKRKIQGTGLGLYIAKTLAIAMGGTLKFRSTLGKGSTFFLTVPIKSKIPSMIPTPDHNLKS